MRCCQAIFRCLFFYRTIDMCITWDPQKAETNLQKHRIRFSDAEMVFYDPFAMTMDEQIVETEQRFVTVGPTLLAE